MIWRGEVWGVDLGIPVGHEPGFERPAVVISADILHNGLGRLVAVVPVTSQAYGLRSHVELEPGASGLERTSYARCDQLRVISTTRLTKLRGSVEAEELLAVDRALRFILDL